MVQKKVKVQNPSGLQVKTGGELCDLAMQYDSRVCFRYRNGNIANAKSVLSILGAGIRGGEEIELCCEGIDEKEAVDAVSKLLEGKQ